MAIALPALAFEPFVIKDIRVEGVQRTEPGTVFTYLPVKVGERIDDEKAAAVTELNTTEGLDGTWNQTQLIPELRGGKRPARRPGEYLAANFWVTTSGMFGAQALTCVHQVLGAERILFAVDYPYESSEEGARFIDNAPISEADKVKICHANAESLLGISPG